MVYRLYMYTGGRVSKQACHPPQFCSSYQVGLPFNINELSTSTHELITGNPGVINFYLPFLTAIHHKDKSGTLAILSHSHVGHDPEVEAWDLAATSRNPFIYALSFQLRNTLRVFDALSTWFGINTRIVVIGHSVGAWLALQVAFP